MIIFDNLTGRNLRIFRSGICLIYIFSFCLIISPISLFAISEKPEDQDPLRNFSSLSSAQRQTAADCFFGALKVSDTLAYKQKLGNLIRLSIALKEKQIYVRAMNRYAEFLPLAKALHCISVSYSAASDMKDPLLMGESEKYKSYLHMRIGNYDSAVVALLHAIDIFKDLNDTKNLVESYHTLGDIYFDVELYDKALFCFNKVIELKGNSGAWDAWRGYVITNDLGLIESARGNYDKALEYFFSSLNDKRNIFGNSNKADSSRLVYLYRKIAQVYYNKKDFTNTAIYCNLCLKFLPASGSGISGVQSYLLQGELSLQTGDITNALKYLNKAKELNRPVNSADLECQLSELLARSYRAAGDPLKATFAENRYYHLKDSLEHHVKKAAFLEIIAGHNYENYKTRLENLSWQKMILINIIITITLLAIMLVRLSFSLKARNRYLIEKNIALAFSSGHAGSKTAVPKAPKTVSEPDEDKEDEITGKLEKLIEEEKIYTKPELNLNDLAEELGTNRGILSGLINSRFNKNFNTYINEFRVNEAIKIMANDEMQKYSLEGLANNVGFNNRTTFINAFKKQTGLTPSAFAGKNK